MVEFDCGRISSLSANIFGSYLSRMVKRSTTPFPIAGLESDKGVDMLFQFFPETDMLYIKLKEGISIESEEVAPGIVMDYDAENSVIGIEIEDASTLVDLSKLEISALPLVDLIVRQQQLPEPAA